MLTDRPRLRVAVLCSHRAPGLAHLLDRHAPRGVLYDIVCCLTGETAFAEQATAERHGIPCLSRPIADYYRDRGALVADRRVRAEYDAGLLDALAPARPDLVLLSGYLYVLTRGFLDAFPARILNLHHADLLRTDRGGRPLYPGLHAVRNAVRAGERETRSTVHFVTDRLDQGPAVLRSWAFPVAGLVDEARRLGRDDILRAYAYAQQEWMLATSWGPLLGAAIELVATGRVGIGARAGAEGAGPGPWELDARGRLVAPGRPTAHETGWAAAGAS